MGTWTTEAKGLTVVDAVITLCLIGILIGVVVPKYARVARSAQESAVRADLVNIRTSIQLFRILNGRNPRSLGELIEKKVMLPARVGTDEFSKSLYDQKYLMVRRVDEKGNILDSFGNPFLYDPGRGEVKSSTPQFVTW